MPSSSAPGGVTDAPALAALLNNEKILADLRDGLPFPYTEGGRARLIGYVLLRRCAGTRRLRHRNTKAALPAASRSHAA